MNKDVLAGNWKQIKGQVKEQWGKLTDDEVDRIEGSWDRLVGAVQERYGYEREKAEEEINSYLSDLEKKISNV